MSPVANLLAAPLVTAATVAGAFAVATGWGPAAALASVPASGVLAVAGLASRWPQLGAGGIAVATVLVLLVRMPRTRPFAVAGAAVLLAATVLGSSGTPAVPTVTFLDIGQGDSVLLQDPDGVTVLVDGGKDPSVLDAALRRHRVGRIDLLVATHGDIDHVGGFDGIVRRHAIGRLWVPDQPDLGVELAGLLSDAHRLAIPVDHIRTGASYSTGSIRIETLGPRRRYLTRNDGSIVLWVEADRTLLLPGDIEAIAQSELPPLHPDILLVPHHGSGSTDPGWLTATVGTIAVISVGTNTYGHPAPETLAVLREAGVEPRVTMDEGDITYRLDGG
jgi:competence protein ComEC